MKNDHNRLSSAQYVERAISRYGGIYDYSRIGYRRLMSPITVICPRHGPFMVVARSHLEGAYCPGCGYKPVVGRPPVRAAVKVSTLADDFLYCFPAWAAPVPGPLWEAKK